MAYLDNANSTRVDDRVIEAMLPYLREHYGTAGMELGHSRDVTAMRGLENARKILAQSINTEPLTIVFTSGQTESNNLAIRGAALANSDKGKHVITCATEVMSVLQTCKALEKEGFDVDVLDVDQYGLVDIAQLTKRIRSDTILVSIQHANGEIGTVQPIEEIAKITSQRGILFHTDATQSYLKIPIDTKTTPLDMITFDAHHIHGPKGIGALYIRKGTRLQRIMEGGDEERRLRPGVPDIPAAVGFGKAVEVWGGNEPAQLLALRKYLEQKLAGQLTELRSTGHPVKRLPNLYSMIVEQIEGESMLVQLDMEGFAVSTGSACSSKTLQGSHVLKAIGLPPEISHGSVRVSLSRFNTKQEIDAFVQALVPTVERLREFSPLRRGEYFAYESNSEDEHQDEKLDEV
ncbi:MAG: cysteine desulfurase NifS [Candidatus Thorarchaeota archaeon]|nr:MAG: cysteine desulfurase NifS [Candidatus Thorarchaeota archaeon]